MDDARAIKGVFERETPELDRARPVTVSMSSPGHVAQVRCGLALDTFPEDSPKKYLGDNVIHIELIFDGVNEVLIRGYPSEERASVRLARGEDRIEFELSNSALSVEISCEVVSLSRIIAYVDDTVGSRI